MGLSTRCGTLLARLDSTTGMALSTGPERKKTS